MATFKPLTIRKYQRKSQIVTPDSIYWNRLSKPELLKEHSTIDYIDFSSSDPDNFVLTCSVRVQIYNLITKLVVKNLSRFQKTAYGAKFRQDGRLLAAGDEEGHVKLFDTSSRNILRIFKGHTAPVHRTFFTANKMQITSFADDRSVRLWDIGNEQCVRCFDNAHDDYVRAGATHQQGQNMFISGGYDGKIKLYDTRSEQAIVRTLDHGSPVESLLYLPNGSAIISAGGTQIRVWDMLSGCRLLTMLSQHHKTVTCLSLGSDGQRLFSGGLDRHVKIYDVSSYKTVHTLTYPNAVVSLGVAAKDQAVVAGMVDGLVSIKHMSIDSEPSNLNEMKISHRKQRNLEEQRKSKSKPKTDHVVKGIMLKHRLQSYDHYLRKYEYKKALDVVLMNNRYSRRPEVIVTVINELLHRDALLQALTNQSEKKLITFINFICKNIGEMRFMRTLTNAASIALNIFEYNVSSYSKEMTRAFCYLSYTMKTEIQLTMDMLQLKGALDMLIGVSFESSDKAHKVSYVPEKEPRLYPSEAAEKYVVYVD